MLGALGHRTHCLCLLALKCCGIVALLHCFIVALYALSVLHCVRCIVCVRWQCIASVGFVHCIVLSCLVCLYCIVVFCNDVLSFVRVCVCRARLSGSASYRIVLCAFGWAAGILHNIYPSGNYIHFFLNLIKSNQI